MALVYPPKASPRKLPIRPPVSPPISIDVLPEQVFITAENGIELIVLEDGSGFLKAE